MPENTIRKKGVTIVVQSCESDWANIGVFYGDKCAYHHVYIPSLVVKHREVKPFKLDTDTFDRVLQENKEELLAMVERLSAE